MTQSDTMARGTDHKTWETTLSPNGRTVPVRNRFFLPHPSTPPHPRVRDESARVVPRQRLLIAAKHYSKADNVGRRNGDTSNFRMDRRFPPS